MAKDFLETSRGGESTFWKVLKTLSSLKITVVLFSLSMFLVLVGTLAQATEGLWAVINDYFRSFVVYIPLQAFVPPAWFPDPDLQSYLDSSPVGILFPGGKTLGVLLMVNLIAAHVVRFKANGSRASIQTGCIFVGIGLVLTVLIVLGASYKNGIQDQPYLSYAFIWRAMLSAIIAIAAAMVGMFFFLEKSQNLERILLVVGVVLAGTAALGLYVLGAMYEQMESAMRIVWQLTQATVVGAVLLTGCAMIFRNRGGIVLLHFGISLMMVNELFVGMYAVEERITVAEGTSTQYSYNTQDVELAITHRGEDEDKVVSIPIQQLYRGNVVSHEELPFDLRVECYFPNSQLERKSTIGGVDSITMKSRGFFTSKEELLQLQPVCGRGLYSRAYQIKRWAGAAAQQRVDMATAYVTVLDAKIQNAESTPEEDNDKVIGNVLMLSQHYSERSTRGRDDGANAEKIMVDGKVYELSLRFRRTQKPYSIFLTDVKEESHHGSTSHKKFGSDFLITDRQSGEIQKGSITMNNPLRFRGETFYQSGYSQMNTSKGPVEVSTFQVVTNQSWMIPYIGCMYVVIGMLAQFGSGMLKFSERIQKRKAKKQVANLEKQIPKEDSDQHRQQVLASTSTDIGKSTPLITWIIPIVIAILGLYTSYKLTMGKKAKSGDFDIRAAGGIPMSSGGRFQPMDTFARVRLRNSSDYESVSLTDEQVKRGLKGGRKRIYATEWLLDVMTNPGMADEEYRIFRIYDPFLISKLDIEKKRKGYTYTYNEVTHDINEFNKYVQAAIDKRKKDGKSDGLSFQQRKALSLFGQIQAYENLRNTSFFVDVDSDDAVDQLLNGQLLYNPILPDIKADNVGDTLARAIASRIIAEENAKSATYMNAIFRFVRTGGTLVAGQANNPLFSPTCDVADVEVADATERLSLPVGPSHESGEIRLGSLVRQLDDGTIWRLVDDRRDEPTSPSKELDWEIQPGMEVLLVSTARLAIREFCERNNIQSFEALQQELSQRDADFLNFPDDPTQQNEFLLTFEKQQKERAEEYWKKYLPQIKAVFQDVKNSEPSPEEIEDLKDKIIRTLILIRIEGIKTIKQEYQRYVSIFYQTDMEERTPATDKFYQVLKSYQAGSLRVEAIHQKIYELKKANESGDVADSEFEEKMTELEESLEAAKEESATEFNKLVDDYKTFFKDLKLSDYDGFKVSLELFYHYSSPLFQALIFYGLAALLVVLTWVFYGVSLENMAVSVQRSAYVLLALGSLVHTAGIVERVIITGKAPVTNLYASAVFISWGSVMCGFIIDLIVRYASPKASKIGLGALLGSIMGFAVIIVSFSLALRTDTFGKVEAVLDTQFWLATHVVCVTFGYVATFVAGALGGLFIFGSLLSPSFDKDVRQGVSWIIYGIVCFALLLSFFGTVLGGLWADDSWGRFWGWDPKENGALLIVIWNALILHARWGGIVRERGVAILALCGNIVTCWSWFGVNELGVGLHSYGFTDGLLATLCWIALIHLMVVVLASLIPTSVWVGYRDVNQPSPVTSPSTGPAIQPENSNPKSKPKRKGKKR